VGPSTTKSDRISSADTRDRFEGTGSAEDEEVEQDEEEEAEDDADENEEADAGEAKHEVTEAEEDAEVIEGGELSVVVEAVATGFWTRNAVMSDAATAPPFLVPRDRSRSHWSASAHKCASGCEMASRSRVRLGVMSEKQCEGAQKRVPGSKCAGEVASCDVEGP
jgi:hypothetical protein